MKWIGLAVAAVGLLASAGASNAATNLVQNGSFEDFIVDPSFSLRGTPVDWTVTGGGAVYDDQYFRYLMNGQHGFVFRATGTSSVSQTVATTVGQDYKLTFDIATLSDFGVSTIIAAFGDQSVTANAYGIDGDNTQPYFHYSFDFIADATSTLLDFTYLGATTFEYPGLELDQVQVLASSVPEPGVWAMLLAGFGIVGAGLRSRRGMTPARA